MPHKPLRQCAVKTCPNLVEKHGDTFCKVHKKFEEEKYDKYLRGYSSHERYDAKWNKVRNIYIKAHPICEECKKEKATIVHHKIPVGVDESKKYDFSNLESVCASCHQKIHNKLAPPTYKF